MKSFLIAVWSILLLVSCSSSTSNNTPAVSSSIYNPPIWIQGTWGIKANGGGQVNDDPRYKFTTDNICQITAFSSQCWKEGINSNPQGLSGSETITSDTYVCVLGGGGTSVTLTFKKVSATKIMQVNTVGNLVLEKLN